MFRPQLVSSSAVFYIIRKMLEMSLFLNLVFQLTLYTLLLSSCEGTTVTLSPLGMVSVCPGGQVLLKCEIINGSFLYWDVSIPHLAMSREAIVPRQGDISATDLQFNQLRFTVFNVRRTSESPLISQLLINNVTTEINGSSVYCSEDGDENEASAVAVNIILNFYNGRSSSLTVSLVNELFGNSNVTVTLQWPGEAGAVYHVNTLSMPGTLPIATEFISGHHSDVVINLTIPYNIQINLSIISSLCGATTTKVLKYVTCDLPTQLFNFLVAVVNGSQDRPPIEGKFITYTCPPGFVLMGPNTSVCTGNGEWEPDPGHVICIADCGVPLSNAKLNYSSTLESSLLTLTCGSDTSTHEQILSVTCHSNGSWIPDPAGFTCSSHESTTVPSGFNNESPGNTLLIIFILILSGAVLILLIILTVCAIKRMCMVKRTSESVAMEEPKQQPVYDEITQYHEEIQVEGNAAYGHVIHVKTAI